MQKTLPFKKFISYGVSQTYKTAKMYFDLTRDVAFRPE
jgi:hypothetical protein